MATCLYKPKPCSRCGAIIPLGAECNYDGETKTISHNYECVTEPPSAEQYRIADECGYIPAADIGRDGWPAVCQGWMVRRMSEAGICPSAGRPGRQARGRNGDLFGEE